MVAYLRRLVLSVPRQRGPARSLGIFLLLASLLLPGCGADEPTDPAPVCGQDESSLAMKNTIERVGGLRTSDWVVRLARSTELGVVVLVDGDLELAKPTLVDEYDVALVEPWEDWMDTATALIRIRQLVEERCPAPS